MLRWNCILITHKFLIAVFQKIVLSKLVEIDKKVDSIIELSHKKSHSKKTKDKNNGHDDESTDEQPEERDFPIIYWSEFLKIVENLESKTFRKTKV